jgi:hypothetical protein
VRCFYFSFVRSTAGSTAFPTGFACCNQLPHHPHSAKFACFLQFSAIHGVTHCCCMSVTEHLAVSHVHCKRTNSLSQADCYACTVQIYSLRCGLRQLSGEEAGQGSLANESQLGSVQHDTHAVLVPPATENLMFATQCPDGRGRIRDAPTGRHCIL